MEKIHRHIKVQKWGDQVQLHVTSFTHNASYIVLCRYSFCTPKLYFPVESLAIEPLLLFQLFSKLSFDFNVTELKKHVFKKFFCYIGQLINKVQKVGSRIQSSQITNSPALRHFRNDFGRITY